MIMDKKALFEKRQARIAKAINFEPVDTVPCTFLGPAYSAVTMGMSMERFCTDADAALEVSIQAMEKHGDIDGINTLVAGLFPAMLTQLWLSRVEVPGRDLPVDVMWQVHEKEVMSAEDYDIILDKGWEAFVGQHLPKVIDMAYFQQNAAWMQANITTVAQKYHERGFATLCCGATEIPFEALCGARSMNKFYFDLYRMPDKVQAACDIIQPFYINHAINSCNITGVRGIWVGGWRAASAMVAPKFWDRFVFPYYLDMITKLANEDIISVLHWDQDWGRDLHRLLEFPAKKCVFSPDGSTDIRKAREILGDHMAIMGDVPAAILASGTPNDVRNYVRDLIRDLGKTGLIMNSGCDIPFGAKAENVQAMVDANREFGAA